MRAGDSATATHPGQARQGEDDTTASWHVLSRDREAARIEALHGLGLLDTAPEPFFDSLTQVAAQACGTPMALVSLVDEQRQWFKSRVGLDVTETPREMAFCNYALDRTEPFVVADTSTDRRFRDNALVTGEPHLRAYAGAPLITADGDVLGTLCVLDREPRDFTESQLELLSGLARQVVGEIELRRRVVDLTEELTLAEALRLAEQRWRLTFDSSPVGIALVTPSGRFEQVNPALGRILDCATEIMHGTAGEDVIHPEDLAAARQTFCELIGGTRTDVQLEHRWVRADGTVIWVRVSAALVRDPAGEPLHVVAHVDDVTEQRVAQQRLDSARQELAARQAFVETLLDTVEVGIVACDENGRLQLFNRAARTWHGIDEIAESSAGELDPTAWADRYDLFEADGETHLSVEQIPLVRAAQGRTVRGEEIQIKPAGGPAVHVSCAGRAIAGPDGAPLGAVVAMSDVTEDRARTRELVEAQAELAARTLELQRSNTELEQFAAVASHDLKAPLGVLQGYLDLLADEYAEVFDERAQSWLTRIERSTTRMTSLLDALLDHARIESGPPRSAHVDVEQVLDLVLIDLSAKLDGAEVVATGDDLWLSGDPELVHQLLQNLVSNALTHRDPGRPCRVEVGVRRLPPAQGDGWQLTVADNGPGIPHEQRDAAFAMFSRGRSAGQPGHGIGLATCQRIVQRHGGSIWVEETPGGGATICCTLLRR